MNPFKLYFNLVSLQHKLLNQYVEGMVRGMEDVNREFAEEVKGTPYDAFTKMYKDYSK